MHTYIHTHVCIHTHVHLCLVHVYTHGNPTLISDSSQIHHNLVSFSRLLQTT